jgi:uncharacterized membrane protein HdeD (DUF308 family)
MVMPVSAGAGAEQPAWVRILLGAIMLLAGIVVLGDVVTATLFSVFFIGWAAIVVGAFELIHAFWTKGWGGFIWQIILGVLYIASGIILINQPVAGVLILTWLLGIFFIASGAVRVFVSVSNWADSGWMLLISGIFSILAGFVILSGWPMTGLWVIGFLLGIDLILHGIGWLAFSWSGNSRTVQGAA